MKSLNFCRLCKRTLQISLQRGLYTGHVLSARQRRKLVDYTMKEPGIQNRKELYADPDMQHEEFDDYDDFILEESVDIENIDRAYDEDKREKNEYRKSVHAGMTYSKYFAPPKQPSMLTSNEIECIKYLHKNDPLNWDVKALSENYPATPEIIRKILKSRHEFTPERKKKRDEAVYKNWELLAAGELEADPNIIEHCKKFINRKEVLLEHIKNTKFYMPEVKKEPMYNNGEMSKILVHYEKQLKKLEEEKHPELLPDECKQKREKKKYIELLHEKVEKEMSKRIIKKESSVLRKMINSYAKEMTLKELENKTIKRVENNKNIDLAEKALLESKFGAPQFYAEPAKEEMAEVKTKEIPQKLLKKESVKIKNDEWRNFNLNTYEDDLPDLPSPDERTCYTGELGVGKMLNKIKNQAECKTESIADNTITVDVDTSHMSHEEEIEHFDKQIEDIKNTPFWNNSLRSKEKADLELHKEPVKAPVEYKRITKSDVQILDEYPLKIPVPKSKRGSGLTFRLKDCFYDDDGEFLYRVPGMLQEKTNQ